MECQIYFEITENLKNVSNAIAEYTRTVEHASSSCRSFEDGATNYLKNIVKESTSFVGSMLSIANNTKNLKILTFAQSAYTKAVSSTTHALSVYQQGVSTARSAIASTTGATKAMNIAIASSPYLLVAAAVATLGVGIYNLAVNNSEAAKAQKRLDEAMLGMNKEISSEQLSLDTLFNSLYKAKEGTEEWNHVKDDIQKKYGNYLNQLGIEITNVDTARLAYKKLSVAIIDTARARASESALSSAGDVFADKEGEALTKMRNILTKKYGEETGDRIFEGIAASIRRGDKEIPERWMQFVNKLNKTIVQSYGTAGTASSYIDNPLTPYIYNLQSARKDYEEEVKRINAVFGTPLEETAMDTGKPELMINSGADKPAEGSMAKMKAELADLEKSLANTPVGTAVIDIQLRIDSLKAQISTAENWIEHEAFKKRYGEIAIPMNFTPVGGSISDMVGRYQDEAMKNNPDMKSSMLTKEGLENMKLPVPELPDIEQPLSDMERWNNMVDQMRAKNADMIDGLGSMGVAVGTIGDLVGGAAGEWLDWGANCMQAIASAIPQIMALCTAQGEQTIANTGVAATGAASSVASIPIVGPILAVAAVASVLAALAAIPKFAAGGIAFGPTFGLFGEYSGAKNNPEVVAPLNRLRSLLQPVGATGGEVNFRIRDRYLEGVLQRRNNHVRRTR